MTVHRHDAPTPESDEHYVREVIDAAMSGSRPPHDLAAGALAHGRRLRTQRRVAVACSAVAATLLVVVAAPLVLDGAGTSTRDGNDLVATQAPAPVPQAPQGWWDMPALDMVNAVGAIVPDGIAVTELGPLEADTPEGGPATGWIAPVLAGPGGSGRLNLMLYPDPARTVPRTGGVEPDRLSCDEEHEGRTRCTQIVDEKGDVVGRRLTNRWGGTVTYEVVLRRDGGTVYAASANTLDEKWGADSPPSADRPPLTLDQLEDLVRNDVWVSYRT
jgi:hypothetical protein